MNTTLLYISVALLAVALLVKALPQKPKRSRAVKVADKLSVPERFDNGLPPTRKDAGKPFYKVNLKVTAKQPDHYMSTTDEEYCATRKTVHLTYHDTDRRGAYKLADNVYANDKHGTFLVESLAWSELQSKVKQAMYDCVKNFKSGKSSTVDIMETDEYIVSYAVDIETL